MFADDGPGAGRIHFRRRWQSRRIVGRSDWHWRGAIRECARSGSGATSARRRPSRPGSRPPGATWYSRSTATFRTTRPRFRAFSAELEKGYDVVSGWKKTRHDPWHKVYPSRVFNWMVSRVSGCRLHDHNCGFKLYRSEVLREVGIYGELHRFIPVLAHARGFRVARGRGSSSRAGGTARPSMASRGFSRGFSTC